MDTWDVDSVFAKKIAGHPYSHVSFIHIPKTGGTSVRKYFKQLDWCLDNKTNAHGRIQGLPQELVDSTYFWGIFRDPYDRARSIYKHMVHFNKVGLSFKDFWTQVFTKGTVLNLQYHDPTNVVLKPQTWWFHPKLKLFSFDNLKGACQTVALLFNIETEEEFTPENVSPKDIEIEVDEQSLRIIENLYAGDIIFYNNMPKAPK